MWRKKENFMLKIENQKKKKVNYIIGSLLRLSSQFYIICSYRICKRKYFIVKDLHQICPVQRCHLGIDSGEASSRKTASTVL